MNIKHIFLVALLGLVLGGCANSNLNTTTNGLLTPEGEVSCMAYLTKTEEGEDLLCSHGDDVCIKGKVFRDGDKYYGEFNDKTFFLSPFRWDNLNIF